MCSMNCPSEDKSDSDQRKWESPGHWQRHILTSWQGCQQQSMNLQHKSHHSLIASLNCLNGWNTNMTEYNLG